MKGRHQLLATFRFWLHRWALARAQAIVTAADEWLHRREIALRAEIEEEKPFPPAPIEFNRRASARRERTVKDVRERAIPRARSRTPRLRYAHGEFTRVEP
jgi:hypothetical protein